MDNVQGIIEVITYMNEENGFTIAKLMEAKLKTRKKTITKTKGNTIREIPALSAIKKKRTVNPKEKGSENLRLLYTNPVGVSGRCAILMSRLRFG